MRNNIHETGKREKHAVTEHMATLQEESTVYVHQI